MIDTVTRISLDPAPDEPTVRTEARDMDGWVAVTVGSWSHSVHVYRAQDADALAAAFQQAAEILRSK